MSEGLLKALWVYYYFFCYDKAEVEVKFDRCGNDCRFMRLLDDKKRGKISFIRKVKVKEDKYSSVCMCILCLHECVCIYCAM